MAKARARRLPRLRNNVAAMMLRRRFFAALAIGFLLVLAEAAPARAQAVTVDVTQVLSGYDELTGALIVSVILRDKEPVEMLSDTHVGQKIAFANDGRRLMTAVLREPLSDGAFQVTTNDADELRALVAYLASGHPTLSLAFER